MHDGASRSALIFVDLPDLQAGFSIMFMISFFFADCGKAFNITNGFVEFKGGDTTFGKKFKITCESGYELKGDTHTECQGDGSWSRATVCQPVGMYNSTFLFFNYSKYQRSSEH